VDEVYLDFSKAFDPSVGADSPWLGHVYSLLGKRLSDGRAVLGEELPKSSAAVAQLPGEVRESPSLEVSQNHGDMALRDVGSGWDGIELGDPLGLFQPQ